MEKYVTKKEHMEHLQKYEKLVLLPQNMSAKAQTEMPSGKGKIENILKDEECPLPPIPSRMTEYQYATK